MRQLFLAIIGVLLAALSITPPLQADGIVATINRPEAALEDQLLLTVTVEGSRSAQPELPDLSDFDVYSRGQSTQMSFVNGQVTSSVSYNYVLVPKRTGSFVIGPATVEVGGEVYSSQPIQVRIVGAAERPRETQDVFLSAKVSTTNPYVGQEVVYIWRFYRRVRIGDARLEPQDFQGFLVEDLGDVREYEATVNGVQYLVSEIRKALFPQEEGTTVIPPSRLTVDVLVRNSRGRSSAFDSFFGTTASETKTLRTPEIQLEVSALPEASGGFSGLVGDFDIQARISKAELQVGESATLKITVSGAGNVQMIGEPSLPELADFKVYDDKPTGVIDRSGARLTGTRTFSKAIVPLLEGDLTIPPIGLTFFDPEAGEFRDIRTAPIALRVSPRDGEEDLNLTESVAPSTGKVAVRILADDLLPIEKGIDAARPPWTHRLGELGVWTALLVPPLAFVALWLSQGASRCLREYIGDKLGLEGSALTPAEVEHELQGRGVDAKWVRQTAELLQQLESAQYGGDTIESAEIVTRIEELVTGLERQLGR